MRYLRSFKLLFVIIAIGSALAYIERQRADQYGHLAERTHARVAARTRHVHPRRLS